MSSAARPQQELIQAKDREIALLRERCASLSQQLQQALQPPGHLPESPSTSIMATHTTVSTNGRSLIATQRERIGRTASLATRQVLDSIHAQEQRGEQSNKKQQQLQQEIVPRILQMFQSPAQSMEYLQSARFAQDLLALCAAVAKVLEKEPRCLFVQSPVYVFGDIHGNLEDLHFFSDNIWRLGMSLTAGNFLFLGDYVDRGLQCLETVAYLLAMKVTLPAKVYLLRGNHETRDVNGWEEHYHQRSFLYQCRARFGNDLGYRVWETCNSVFDRLPLAAVIDQDIFCVHGGIPRPIASPSSHGTLKTTTTTTRIQDILAVPKVAGINPPYEHEDDLYQQVASDCIWSDPASEQQELYAVDPATGFGESLRGGGAICFGHTAVTQFLQQHQLSYIMRAHEAHAEGVAVSKGARVFTVFSTSQDHNQGSNAMAGCILVDNSKLQVINRSPAYKNQYVHRRDSVSLASLSEQEIQKRIQLGLVTPAAAAAAHHASIATVAAIDNDVELEDWQDIMENEDDEEEEPAAERGLENGAYKVATQRRSSVDLGHMSVNVHDAAIANPRSANTASQSFSALPDHQNALKRQRYRQPSIASISEEEPSGVARDPQTGDDEEVATVDGSNSSMDDMAETD